MKEIYIIRHGETDFNQKGIVQGRGVDTSLNERGRKQAAKFYNAYKNEGFDKIYVSTLKRTVETVEDFNGNGTEILPHAGLDEISWGIHEGKSSGDTFRQFYEILHAWSRGELDVKILDGESPLEVQNRQQEFLKELEVNDGKKILICSHGRAMRILLCTMLAKPLQFMDTFPHQNVCLYKLNFADSVFTVEKFNDTTHLGK
ncbi:MAG: histidine phosphatase family protein [Chitinophagales bacterium]